MAEEASDSIKPSTEARNESSSGLELARTESVSLRTSRQASKVSYFAISLDDDRLYQNDIMENLGDMYDVGVNSCGCSGQQVTEAFIASGLAYEFERVNPAFVAGRSGAELIEIMGPQLGIGNDWSLADSLEPTPDFWVGWSLGYFQTETSRPYRAVFGSVSYSELREMYWPLHEAPEDKFVEVVEDLIDSRIAETNLARFRRSLGWTQSQLSDNSGVTLRSIQMYEQRNKDINKAQSETMFRLATTLGCSMESLLER